MKTVGLVLAFHVHQPVGNLDDVVHRAMNDSYMPLLEAMDGYQDIPFCVHVSGCLWEWAQRHRPEYIEKIVRFVERGQVEIIGGGFSEPIFTMLPRRDVVGQVRTFAGKLKEKLGVEPSGAWLPERVWEQHLSSVLGEAGVSYTIVDDHHVKRAGVADSALYNVFVTEDEGRILKVFPSCEMLRYLIPFKPPERTIEFLRTVASEDGQALAVYADDGEKFGVWPGTRKHVFEDGWLRRFLESLRENSDWIRLLTFSEALERGTRPGRTYIPDASYREMTEWALPSRRLADFRELEAKLGRATLLDEARPFFGGGMWRNFKVKYLEASKLYARMMEASAAVESAPAGQEKDAARLDLYRGQCNCVHWHGVFGGLYMPHLRYAAYKHLLEADRLCLGSARPASTAALDLDFDGVEEIRMERGAVKAYVAPARGGHVYEADLLDCGFNPLASMTRRFEDYHSLVTDGSEAATEVKTIHDKRPTLGKHVKQRMLYDSYERETAVDRFFTAPQSAEDFIYNRVQECGDFASGDYDVREHGGKTGAFLAMVRKGAVKCGRDSVAACVEKTIEIPGSGPSLMLHWKISPAGPLDVLFGSEFNLAMLSGSTHDRYYVGADGSNLGPLGSVATHRNLESIGLVDEWLKVRVELVFTPAATVYLLPVETVSQSEGGYELLYQQSCVIPCWNLKDAEGPLEARVEMRFLTGDMFRKATR